MNKWIDNTNKIQLTIKGSISNPNIDALGQKNDATPTIDSRNDSRVTPMEQRTNRKPALNPVPVKPQPVRNLFLLVILSGK